MSTHPVYVISGVAGSGKTTLAHAWAPTMGAAIVELDVVAANVVDTALREHPEATQWQINAAYRAQRYRCLIDAITSERRSASVMAVAPFTQEIAGEAPWAQFVRDIGGDPVHLVWVQTGARALSERIALRGAARDEGRSDAAVPTPPPVVPHHAVKGELPVPEIVATLRSRFDNEG